MLQVIGSILSILITTLIEAFVLSKLYVWFLMVPFALPTVPWYTFIAVTIMVQITRPTNIALAKQDAEETSQIERFIYNVITPLIALGVAYPLYLYFV